MVDQWRERYGVVPMVFVLDEPRDSMRRTIAVVCAWGFLSSDPICFFLLLVW